MKSQSLHTSFRTGDLVSLTQDMISFYNIYGPVDPGFLSGEPVLVVEISEGRAIILDSKGNMHSTSLRKLQHV